MGIPEITIRASSDAEGSRVIFDAYGSAEGRSAFFGSGATPEEAISDLRAKATQIVIKSTGRAPIDEYDMREKITKSAPEIFDDAKVRFQIGSTARLAIKETWGDAFDASKTFIDDTPKTKGRLPSELTTKAREQIRTTLTELGLM